jgi:hypothetical protein
MANSPINEWGERHMRFPSSMSAVGSGLLLDIVEFIPIRNNLSSFHAAGSWGGAARLNCRTIEVPSRDEMGRTAIKDRMPAEAAGPALGLHGSCG